MAPKPKLFYKGKSGKFYTHRAFCFVFVAYILWGVEYCKTDFRLLNGSRPVNKPARATVLWK